MAWADNDQGAPSKVAQDYSLSPCGGGYNCGNSPDDATSAYVLDHTCNNRFNNLQAPCDNTADNNLPQPSTSYVNYAFFDTGAVAVPEPSSFLGRRARPVAPPLRLTPLGFLAALVREAPRRDNSDRDSPVAVENVQPHAVR